MSRKKRDLSWLTGCTSARHGLSF